MVDAMHQAIGGPFTQVNGVACNSIIMLDAYRVTRIDMMAYLITMS